MNDTFRSMTCTDLFIVPIFGLDRRELMMELGFEGAYKKDEIKGIDYPNSVYLLFRPFDLEVFESFLEREKKKGFIIDEYDHIDRYVVLVCQYDAKLQPDIDLLMQGKFSKVSNEYKKLIPKTISIKNKAGVIEKPSIQNSIFNKDKVIKDYWKKELGLEFEKEDEIWHFYEEREILTQEMLEKMTIA